MAKSIKVGTGEKDYPKRSIDLGDLTYLIEKYRKEDLEYVLYKLSYGGRYIYMRGKSMYWSLVMFVDSFNSYNKSSPRFKGHLYSHMYEFLKGGNVDGRFRVKVIGSISNMDHYTMLKEEQKLLDESMSNPMCLNNQIEAYIPKYNESTGMYGWFPKTAVMNFRKWLDSAERKGYVDQCKK